jgi:hypothetical protein
MLSPLLAGFTFFMAEPSLIEVFGAGATQSATTITILKSDLPGLTASPTNTAESLLAGIILKAATALTTTARDANPDQSIAIEQGFDQVAYRGTTAYYQSARTITLQKVNTSATIDPDDY